MSVVIDSREHASAVKAALTAELDEWDAYDYDELPGSNGNAGTLPAIFVLVAVERRYNPLLRSARAGATGWRVSVRCVGRTIDEARWAMYHAGLALNEQVLTVDGSPTTRLQFESDEAPAPDDGRYSGRAFYTYTH